MKSLTIRDVSKRYGNGADEKGALRNVSIDVEGGELLVLLGPSGSGKTTLLRCVAGLIEPSEGRIALGSVPVWDSAEGTSIPTHKRDLGMVFQSFALWAHMSVADNVAYPLKARRWSKDAVRARVLEMLRLVHCEAYAERLPATLSGGQQQRVALARALAANPAIILFDEPLSNLDALLRVELRTQLRLIHSETRFTGVYVTHDQVEAMALGDRVAVMNDGRIEQTGSPQDIYFRPQTEYVAAFMGMSNSVKLKRSNGHWDSSAGPLRNCAFFGSVPGGDCVARFRPESVRLVPDAGISGAEEAGALVLRDAKVVDRAFHGEISQYVVRAGDLLLTAAIDTRSACEIGERIAVAVPREDAAVFAESRTEQNSPDHETRPL